MKQTAKELRVATGRDIALSWKDARHGLGIGALLFCAAVMQYPVALSPAQQAQAAPGLSDYLLFAFAGSPAFAGRSGAPFRLPITWFALVFFCTQSCALFPYWMLHGPGLHRLLQSKSRLRWWSRLTFLVVFWSAAYLLLGLLCMTAMGAARYGMCRTAPVPAGALCTVFLTLCVLSELQAFCASLLSPPAGALAAAALMVCAAFWDSPALWPRYSMLVRSSAAGANGFSSAGASIYLIVSFLAIFGLGALLFQTRSILSYEKGR